MVTTTIQMWGNTRAMRIPKIIAEQLNLKTGTQVELHAAKGELVIRPARRQKSYKLSDLLAQCKGPNPHREKITGKAGKEII